MKGNTKKNIKYSINNIKNDTNKVVKMYLNIKKFKHFYKNLNARERKVIHFYKTFLSNFYFLTKNYVQQYYYHLY